ncbi:hypothetical protein ETB97_012224 [Aspergillus alliaceus]|uniref:Uncharacterized protein n=1 Tax=Petromyces alliaceus TaxID=209559 RepID=A0A5N6FYD6_PETAA|nr:uncharacterized protein BDW43DRAFT_275064 [Aspergillus alliaceus]KAB8233774.1 hypothetical protein BDW43DRAFT_275064 [Aspergillus alliaceus]KAF5861989.1 hypothetical protein ETB97_012224 [Aspergillus burnettii]
MPRTLPWLTGSGNSKNSRDSTPKRPARVKSKNNDSDATPKAKVADSPLKKRDFFRSSPTPPSSPIHRCPSEEFLVEGLSHDDIYIMVEDEFYAIAQSFTHHLHYAEYARRKKEVKLQNAAAIRNLARPTDGVTPVSEDTKRRNAADALSARQKAGLERMGSKRPQVDSDEENDEVEEDDTWAGTSLHDLMVSPRKARSLVGMQGIKSSTRAAQGFSQSSGRGNLNSSPPRIYEAAQGHDVETASEDDDLDLQHDTASTRPAQNAHLISSDSTSSNFRNNPLTPTKDRGRKRQSMSTRYKTPTATQAKRRLFFDDFDELPELQNSNVQVQGRGPSPSISTTRQESPPCGNNPQSKKSRLNEVPTFLL